MIKNFITLFFAISVVLSSVAAEVKFDFAGNEFNLPTTTNTNDATKYLTAPISKEGIVITLSKGTSVMGPLMYSNTYLGTLDLRFYKGSAFDITSTSGEAIKSIEFKSNGKLDIAADSGDWTGETYETWVGSASRVSFDAIGSAQIYTIIVTTEAGTVTCAAPTFTPEAGEFYENIEVSISCATEGATIYYTINGEIPTVNSPIFNAPIAITTETIVKAIGIKDAALSSVTEATYSFPQFEVAENIAGFVKLNETTLPIRISNNIVVTYQNAKYLFAKDDSGSFQVYGELNKIYSCGDIIPSGVVGTWNNYGGAVQMFPIANTFKTGTPSSPVIPIEVTISNFDADLANTFVIGKNWNLHVTKTGNSYTYKVSEDPGASLDVFMRFKGIEGPTTDGVYNITGIANIYNGTAQIYPIKFEKSSGVNDITTAGTSITTTQGEIIINAINAGVATIFNAAGSVVKTHEIADGENRISISPGFYIVNVNNKNQKVIVK